MDLNISNRFLIILATVYLFVIIPSAINKFSYAYCMQGAKGMSSSGAAGELGSTANSDLYEATRSIVQACSALNP